MLNLTKIRSLLDTRCPNHTLPQDFYADPDVFAFDVAAIYHQNWIMVGFEAELPECGSYLAFPIGPSPIVVVRGRDGTLRGFYNSCRHRGAQICETGSGTRSWLTCPYHQWTYDLNGTLANAPRMATDLDREEHGLRPIHVEAVAGSIYVCLAERPPPFDAFRDQLTPLLAPHNLANAKLAYSSTMTMRANWKLVMENARECYHCAGGHPELAVTYPVQGRRAMLSGNAQRFTRFRTRMAEAGIDVGPVQGEWWHALRFPLNDGAVTLSMDGRPACTKLLCTAAGGDIGTLGWTLEPHCFAHANSDGAFMFSAMPTGPQETVVTSKWMVHKDAVEGVDYNVGALTELWTKTNEQDRNLCEINQRGVNSFGYVPGPYSEDAEESVMRFIDWYCGAATRYLDRHTRGDRRTPAKPYIAAIAGGAAGGS
jgi:Rieske 2Fe-2S family protein